MNIWEDGTKHELSQSVVRALRALAVGYPGIRPMHGVLLRTYGLSYSFPPEGWAITEAGRRCLEIWDGGDDYDSTANDRKRRDAPGGEAPPDPPA